MSNTLAKILGQGGGGPDVWASGKTVAQYDYVISPTDLEIYQRKTATGSGTTDPYSDSTNYRPAAFDRVSSIANRWSSGSMSFSSTSSDFHTYVTTATLAFAAGVRTSILSISGRASLRFFCIQANSSALSGTVRLEVLIDGRTVFDATYSSIAANSYALAAGYVAGSNGSTLVPGFDDFRCSNSLQVFITCSAAQTTAALIPKYAYQGYQS